MKQREREQEVVVIGAGAAGMMAACAAASRGAKVVIFEKNEKAGKKLYITGKGRCNFTNVCETEDFFPNVVRNPSFLYSSVYCFDAHAVVEWFEEHGVKTKVERGMRAFPFSDHASDITRCLEKELERLGVEVRFSSEVKELIIETENAPAKADVDSAPRKKQRAALRRAEGVLLADGRKIFSDSVIVATGGLSYPSTGSTGDGYRFARSAGHTVSTLSPSLVPFNVREKDILQLQGLSLKNVTFTILDGKKKLFHDMGEMMFTHFGVTGPLILSASALVQDQIAKGPLAAFIDLKPALSQEKLDARILREMEANRNRSIRNAVRNLYPARLVPVILDRAGIDALRPVHDITAAERRELVLKTKRLDLTLISLRTFQEAVITRGGVDVRQVDPGTMESRLVKGLYFAGEVLDVDAMTGGFNLQIAWSTGRAAGEAAALSPGLA